MAYLFNNFDDLLESSLEHLNMVAISLALAVILAFVIIYLCLDSQKAFNRLTYFFSALYAIPSYASFALLIPITGLGTTSAVVVLTLYSEYILLRSFATGIREIDPVIIESAAAMGMTSRQIFFKVQLPLASKSIFSGIKLTLTTMINIAMIAATINAGGLGSILFDGLRTQDVTTILWGAIFSIILCIVCSLLIDVIEKWTTKNLNPA